ncbi:stage II sporulation protein AB (anti-sigma F factor) [Hathewaya proteolytica DSM 3090]|uniref:Anti-sigma F factor n=1 Tax=Hathewaya proteolytica DSM 3090 TaxID=1121331 RepID=A0A1M6PA39_9CLOT|nr:anti-sigma F factor [Hathewaya proteolytica]SHK04803.1 stage II sporulation protein AB (anti-sigma F factor) [Hathewaya proteolytica DSM 3090]
MQKNMMKLEFQSKSENESFARVAVAAFATQLDPTLEEISDIKTAVSEAVTNAIIHGYGNEEGIITIESYIEGNEFTVIVSDKGKGIEDVELAVQPLYTSRPDLERSGIGFTVMETFMDDMNVVSECGQGTRVTLKKIFKI